MLFIFKIFAKDIQFGLVIIPTVQYQKSPDQFTDQGKLTIFWETNIYELDGTMEY
jgi:hypothetical protein